MSQKSTQPQPQPQLSKLLRAIKQALAKAPSPERVRERRAAAVSAMSGARSHTPRYLTGEVAAKEADKDFFLRACLEKVERTEVRFAKAEEQNEADIERLTASLAECVRLSAEHATERDRLRDQCDQLEAQLQEQVRAAEKRRDDQAEVVLAHTRKGDMAAALEAANTQTKYSEEAAAAVARLTAGPERSVISAIAPELERAESACRADAGTHEALRAELETAKWRRVQIKTTRAALQLVDDYVGAVAALGDVGEAPTLELQGAAIDPELMLEGADLATLLSRLSPPRYDLLEVDFASLRSGNEPVVHDPDEVYWDADATARSGHHVNFVADTPARPGERPVTINCADPEQDPQRYVRRVTG